MAKEVSRRIPLDGEEDFLDVRIFIEKRRVVGFVLNYTAVVHGEEMVVCRYDTCHGHLHLHRSWVRDGAPQDLDRPGAIHGLQRESRRGGGGPPRPLARLPRQDGAAPRDVPGGGPGGWNDA